MLNQSQKQKLYKLRAEVKKEQNRIGMKLFNFMGYLTLSRDFDDWVLGILSDEAIVAHGDTERARRCASRFYRYYKDKLIYFPEVDKKRLAKILIKRQSDAHEEGICFDL